MPFPHLHVYGDFTAAGRLLQKLHLPTDRIGVEDIVLLLIDGFEILPQPAYARIISPHWVLFGMEDFKEGVNAFMEKRNPT